MTSTTKAFRALHVNRTPLLLANAWDAGSARLIESLGAAAVATTSAGMAWSLGYRDGRIMPADQLIAAASRMARVVTVPLSIDIENGYSDDPAAVAELAMRLVDMGVAGINIEDGRDDPAMLARKIEAIRQAVSKSGGDLFVNARCDVILAGLVEQSEWTAETIRRGQLYARSGADGVFVPAIQQPDHIKAVAGALPVPLNAMAIPGLADASDLGLWGVRRLSAGSGMAQVLWRETETLARQFLDSGRSDVVTTQGMPYGKLQGLFPT